MLREQIGVRKLNDRRALLPPQLPQDLGKRTLVVDLDETLVHSSFQVRGCALLTALLCSTSLQQSHGIKLSSLRSKQLPVAVLRQAHELKRRLVRVKQRYVLMHLSSNSFYNVHIYLPLLCMHA
jgi:TFIIF-interacting CTD phosphatase-like protein